MPDDTVVADAERVVTVAAAPCGGVLEGAAVASLDMELDDEFAGCCQGLVAAVEVPVPLARRVSCCSALIDDCRA